MATQRLLPHAKGQQESMGRTRGSAAQEGACESKGTRKNACSVTDVDTRPGVDPFASNFELTGIGRSRLMQLSASVLSAALQSRQIKHNSSAQLSQLVSKLEGWKRERAHMRRYNNSDSDDSSSGGEEHPSVRGTDRIAHGGGWNKKISGNEPNNSFDAACVLAGFGTAASSTNAAPKTRGKPRPCVSVSSLEHCTHHHLATVRINEWLACCRWQQ